MTKGPTEICYDCHGAGKTRDLQFGEWDPCKPCGGSGRVPLIEALKRCAAEMSAASSRFYAMAQQTHCHPFIEFTGFMNEYIKIASKAAAKGIDFRNANTHSGIALPMETYEAAYIAEKFDCIFGPTLRQNPAAYEAFKRVLESES